MSIQFSHDESTGLIETEGRVIIIYPHELTWGLAEPFGHRQQVYYPGAGHERAQGL